MPGLDGKYSMTESIHGIDVKCAWVGWQMCNASNNFSVYVLRNDNYDWIGWQISTKDCMMLIF